MCTGLYLLKFQRKDFLERPEKDMTAKVPIENQSKGLVLGEETTEEDHKFTLHQKLKHIEKGYHKVTCSLASEDSKYLFVAIRNKIEVWVRNGDHKFEMQAEL